MKLKSEVIPPIFKSSAAFSEYFKIPAGLVSWARKEGCDAFRSNNSVHTASLIRFLFARRDDEESGVDNADLLKKYQAAREKIKLDKESGTVLDRGEAAADCIKAVMVLEACMDRTFTVEMPAALRGLDAPEIERALLVAKEKFKTLFKNSLAELAADKPKEESE